MKLSVIVCTRNRARSLAAMLERFAGQNFAGNYDYELIVVDNCSNAEFGETIAGFVLRHPFFAGRLFVLREDQPGLSRARNRGLKKASGEIIAFTDDDVLVAENWLDEIHSEFANPNLFMLGGRVLLARDTLQDVAIYTPSERLETAFPSGGSLGMGANMAFRREVFDRVGMFDVRLGAGTFFAGGEDIELFYRALKAGYKFVYAPNVLVHHDHDRETPEQACRLIYGYGKANAAYIIKHVLRGDLYAMRMLYWLIRTLPRRWREQDADAVNTIPRQRAQVRGTLIGLLTSPLAMLVNRTE
ncbi:MAG: glycosyltransferase [Acidobacteria bacterium]|nr:glycosyltransferase [Acidobacteriota bacterium]